MKSRAITAFLSLILSFTVVLNFVSAETEGSNLGYPDGLKKSVLQGGREWTPSDSIAVRYFAQVVDDGYTDSGPLQDHWGPRPTLVSPDNKWLVFRTYTGDLKADVMVQELHVFSMQRVQAALSERQRVGTLEPDAKAIIRSRSSRRSAIQDIQWDPESNAMAFRGITDADVYQVFVLDIVSADLRQLTKLPHGVRRYSYRNGSLLANTFIPAEHDRIAYPMEAIRLNGKEMKGYAEEGSLGILTPHSNPSMLMSYRGSIPVPIERSSDQYWIAPGGRQALLAYRTKDPNKSTVAIASLETGDIADVPDLFLPQVWRCKSPLWFPHGAHAILACGNDVFDIDLQAREHSRILSGGTSDGVNPATNLQLSAVRWISSGREFALTYRYMANQEQALDKERRCVLKNGKWNVSSIKNSKKGVDGIEGLVVDVRQSANDPPVMIASNGKQEVRLTAPDKVLEEVVRAKWKPLSWREEDGHTQTGGLLLPQNAPANGPLPLVVQVPNYYPDLFLPDGPGLGTTSAAQSLAARGIAVLQIFAWTPGTNRREGPQIVKRIDAAVGSLAAQMLVDMNRVGLTGFSRGGYLSYFAITHPGRVHLAAAVAADSFRGDFYNAYMLQGSGMGPSSAESFVGSSFWESKADWLELDTTFNLDRVRTPILFTTHYGAVNESPDRYLDQIKLLVGTFNRNRKPFEFLIAPEGSHPLVRPRERLAIMEAVVDWMVFWLKGKVPADVQRTERWMKLREQQESVLAAARDTGEPMPSLPPLDR